MASKFGVSPQAAQNLAASLVPTVMSQFVKKTIVPADSSVDLTSIMKTVSGNNSLDVGSILSQVAGGGAGIL